MTYKSSAYGCIGGTERRLREREDNSERDGPYAVCVGKKGLV